MWPPKQQKRKERGDASVLGANEEEEHLIGRKKPEKQEEGGHETCRWSRKPERRAPKRQKRKDRGDASVLGRSRGGANLRRGHEWGQRH